MKLCLCVSGTSSANLEGFLAPNESFIQSLIFIFFFVECFFLNLYFSLSLFNNSRASHVHMRDFKQLQLMIICITDIFLLMKYASGFVSTFTSISTHVALFLLKYKSEESSKSSSFRSWNYYYLKSRSQSSLLLSVNDFLFVFFLYFIFQPIF